MQGSARARSPSIRVANGISGEEPVLFQTYRPNTQRKVELEPATLDARYGAALPAYRPLGLSIP